MAALSARRMALSAAKVIDALVGQTYSNLGTAGTVVAVPAGAYGVQVAGTVDAVFQVGNALGANAARIPANTNPTFGLHQAASSVALAAASGSATYYLNWLKVTDSQ